MELYQSLVAFTLGFLMLGSPLIETTWAGLPTELAERLHDWRDVTFRQILRILMQSYRAGAGEERA